MITIWTQARATSAQQRANSTEDSAIGSERRRAVMPFSMSRLRIAPDAAAEPIPLVTSSAGSRNSMYGTPLGSSPGSTMLPKSCPSTTSRSSGWTSLITSTRRSANWDHSARRVRTRTWVTGPLPRQFSPSASRAGTSGAVTGAAVPCAGAVIAAPSPPWPGRGDRSG